MEYAGLTIPCEFAFSSPPSNERKWRMKSPMLALRIDSLKQEQIDEVWEDDMWDFEQKLNGVRCFIVNDGKNGVQIYSRHNSDVDLLPISFTEKIIFPEDCDLSNLDKSFIIDCEMTSDNSNICTIMGNNGVVTNSQLQAVTSLLASSSVRAKTIQRNNDLLLVFNSFDCVYYDDEWVTDEPLSKRREILETIIQDLENRKFNIRRVLRAKGDKKSFYNSLVSSGGEGCVAKRLDGKYIPDTTRNFNGWIKIKKSAMSMISTEADMDNLFGDTIDAFITGYEPGNKGTAFEKLIGSVFVSVYIEKEDGTMYQHEIGRFSGIDLALREDMTELINGEPTLKPSYYGRVCEVDGLGLSSRELSLNHCTFSGFYYGKL